MTDFVATAALEEAPVQPVLYVNRHAEVSLAHLDMATILVAGNYREEVDPAGLAELAESIKHSGLLQPVATRPFVEPQGQYTHELVAGFRRYAASELAGLSTILATSREMSDQEALEYRVLENLQREDPHPVDEARAVAVLTESGHNTAEIASRLGKTTKWVAERRALSSLLPNWVADLRKDRLTLAAAIELSRWPEETQQRAYEQQRHGGRMDVGTFKYWLERQARQLQSAPWDLDDAELLPSAGACTTCPKRSSCATLLFAELADKDTCLDTGCWEQKTTTLVERRIAEIKAEDETATVYRLSESYGNRTGENTLAPYKYEIVRRKKNTFAGIFVEGPKVGKVYRIILVGTTASPQAPQLSRGEQMKKSRQEKLMKASRKIVLANRILQQVSGPMEQATTTVRGLLVYQIVEQMKGNRSQSDALLWAGLVKEWNWKPFDQGKGAAYVYGGYEKWVRQQAEEMTLSNEKLIHLLLYITVRQGIGTEYTDEQSRIAQFLSQPELTEGLDEAATEQLSLEYDPQTLRRRKAA